MALDDTLLTLWEHGLGTVAEPSDVLVGLKLKHARRILGLPNGRDLRSLAYWKKRFSLTEKETRELLISFGIRISPKASTVPKGAVRKLLTEARDFSIPKPILPEPPIVPPPSDLKWRTVGHKREVRTLDLREVLGIHKVLVDDFLKSADPIDPPGPRNKDIIASAVFRQHTSLGQELKYQSTEMCAAALLHSLVHNHPFHNGNKRTALVSMLVLLDQNGLMLACPDEELFKFILQVAQHKLVNSGSADLADREVLAIAEWIHERTRLIERGDRPLPFRRLRQVLTRYDCTMEHGTSGSKMKIQRILPAKGFFSRKKTLVTSIYFGGEGRDVPGPAISRIRSELQLDEDHSIDSAAFYEGSPSPVDEFIVKYRKILTRLAKL